MLPLRPNGRQASDPILIEPIRGTARGPGIKDNKPRATTGRKNFLIRRLCLLLSGNKAAQGYNVDRIGERRGEPFSHSGGGSRCVRSTRSMIRPVSPRAKKYRRKNWIFIAAGRRKGPVTSRGVSLSASHVPAHGLRPAHGSLRARDHHLDAVPVLRFSTLPA
jgi:hypothetical protein